MSVCLVAFAGGKCATATPNSILNKTYNSNDKAQQWTVEREKNGPKLAFKSNESGQYLRAISGQGYGQITTGDKQWWTPEVGVAPGLFWLKCADFPDAYVCNAGASSAEGNKVYCWPRQQGWAHALQWYLLDSAGGSFVAGASSSGPQAQQLAEREKALTEREEATKRKEAELAEKAAQSSQNNGSKAKEDELAALQKNLQEKENKLKDLEAEIKTRGAKLAESGTPAASTRPVENGTSGDDTKGAEIAQENERLKRELAEARAAVERAGHSGFQPWTASAIQPPQRKLPPIIRPARHLPSGFDRDLLIRAVGPGERVA